MKTNKYLIIILVTLISALSNAYAESAQVHLMSTLKGNPALTSEVSWIIEKQDYRTGVYDTIKHIERRHTTTIALSPGKYRATASMHNRSNRKAFTVQALTESHVELPLD